MTLESLRKKLLEAALYCIVSLILLLAVLLGSYVLGMMEKYFFVLIIPLALVYILLFFLFSQANSLMTYINSRKSEMTSLECFIRDRTRIRQLLISQNDKVGKMIRGATLKFDDVFVDVKNVQCDYEDLRASLLEKLESVEKQIGDREKKKLRRPLLVYLFKNKLAEAS